MATAKDLGFKHAVALLGGWYVGLVGVCALIRLAASYFGASAWIIGSMPWPEIFYGPAIAVAAMFGVPWFGAKIEARLKKAREA